MRTFSYYVNTFRVIDGDTLEATLDLGFHLAWDFNVRLNGLDAPEVHGPTRSVGLLVGAVVQKWMTDAGTDIRIQSVSVDEKYGRLLGVIYSQANESLNQYLLDNSLALPYDGKTKKIWTQSELDLCAANAKMILNQ